MKWISVKDQKPPLNKLLVFFNGKREITLGTCFDIEDEYRAWISDDVRVTNEIATHWIPLPEPPNAVE